MALNQYIKDNDMIACINLDIADVLYTYIGTKSISRVDHFIVSQVLCSSIDTFNIIDNHLLSDHVPICVSFDIQFDHIDIQDGLHVSRTAWWKASGEQCLQYRKTLDSKLKAFKYNNEILSCTNIHCKKHFNDISELYSNIINACIDTSVCIPKTGRYTNNNKRIPGWLEHVEQLRCECFQWNHHY